MARTYQSDDAQDYQSRVVYREPFKELEPPAREREVVGRALACLADEGILPHTDYDDAKFLSHRQAAAERFEIPWSAINPRMQRLLYAINAVHQPAAMVAAGVFCGFTFISNAAAAVGPGACYEADRLIGLEIKPDEAERAERNVRTLDPTGTARVLAADAVAYVAEMDGPIDLLYLDADGTPETGKGVYLTILQACWDKLPPGSLVLAHNSVNAAPRLEHYLHFVRDPANCRQSVNVIFDGEGLEVSRK